MSGTRHGHNIAVLAAAHLQLDNVSYALRDHHVRTDLHTGRPVASATTTAISSQVS